MDEDDHDELLQVTDDDSSGTEDQDHDQCSIDENYGENCTYTSINWSHSKWEFITTKITLLLSSAALIILLPAYLDSVNIRSDAYNLLVIHSTFTICVLLLIIGVGKAFFKTYKNLRITDCPIQIPKMLVLSVVYTISGFLVVYAVDRKRVVCHLQDPIKGCILVFSLLYYFISCKKFMGLQRIFATTTIIVGLFIAVDYGLCDEFRCRGYERMHVSDDTGNWAWKAHSIWVAVYVLGLALFSAYFTLLEKYVLTTDASVPSVNVIPSFLTTISRSVAFPMGESRTNMFGTTSNLELTPKVSSVHITLFSHGFGWLIILLSFWTDITPSIGKGSSISELLNMTSEGIICHFQPQVLQSKELTSCGNTFVFSWLFLISYVLFSIVSIRFLIMSQSAVYTVATISSSLPVVGIWWSLFKMYPLQNGGTVILWSPSLSGELICSLLGLPIVLIGLLLFCKAHFRDCQWSSLTSHYITMPSNVA